MVRCHHEAHLNELAGVLGQPAGVRRETGTGQTQQGAAEREAHGQGPAAPLSHLPQRGQQRPAKPGLTLSHNPRAGAALDLADNKYCFQIQSQQPGFETSSLVSSCRHKLL